MGYFKAEHDDYERRRQVSAIAAATRATPEAVEAMLKDLTPAQREAVLNGESLGDVPTMDAAPASGAVVAPDGFA